MQSKKIPLYYYLFSLSNLIAALGGGLILGKGTSVIDVPYLQGGSILAFFVGTILGLVFLQFIPKTISKLLAQFFSISCGVTSLILYYIYTNFSNETNLTGIAGFIFFILLSIRFGFWFYSRVLRASISSSQQRSIAWVEMGYYVGMVLGLIFWKLLGLNIALGTALIIDACFQFIAGILDFRSNAMLVMTPMASIQETPTYENVPGQAKNSVWCWKLAGSVIFMTIGIQVVIFSLAHLVTEVFSSYILATFYFGVALAAFICNRYKIYISWNSNKFASICTNSNNKIQLNLSILVLTSALAVGMVIYFVNFTPSPLVLSTYAYIFFVCACVLIAAFIYEIITIALLDRIGYEERNLHGSGMIMKTYGLMGLGAATSLWVLGLMNNHFDSSIITVTICLFISILVIGKKESNDSHLAHLEQLS